MIMDKSESLQPPLTSDDLEEVQLELNRFEKSPTTNIPNLLERYLVFVAQNGNVNFSWAKIKPLFRAKLENVIVDFSSISQPEEIPPVPNVDVFNFAAIRNKVFEQLDAFAGIPFTVQRLAELLTAPRRHYQRTDKFMRALEKNMLIVSTVEARANNNNDTNSNRSSFLINGDHQGSNGNLNEKSSDEAKVEDNNGHKNEDLSTSDSIDDELDAEMPEIASNKSVEDEMISEAATTPTTSATATIDDCKKEVVEAEQSVDMEIETRLNEPTSSSSTTVAEDNEVEASNEAATSAEVETTPEKVDEPPAKKVREDEKDLEDEESEVNSSSADALAASEPNIEAEAQTPDMEPESTEKEEAAPTS